MDGECGEGGQTSQPLADNDNDNDDDDDIVNDDDDEAEVIKSDINPGHRPHHGRQSLHISRVQEGERQLPCKYKF